jgi:hypothetical protein
MNTDDAAIETVLRERFWYDARIGEAFDGSYIDLAQGQETIAEFGLADMAAKLFPPFERLRFLLGDGIGSSRRPVGFVSDVGLDERQAQSVVERARPWREEYGVEARVFAVDGKSFVAVMVGDYPSLLKIGAEAIQARFGDELRWFKSRLSETAS